MTDLQKIIPKIRNYEVVTTEDFEFRPKGPCYQILYKNNLFVQEQITPERLKEYQQVAEEFDKWDTGNDFTDIGNWKNLYGDPYWRYKDANLSFKIVGSLDRRQGTRKIRSPEYFNPSCLSQVFRTKESAVLTILLTLYRYTPKEVGYRHHHAQSIIKQLQEITGIGEQTAEQLYNSGVREYADIKQEGNRWSIQSTYRTKALKEIDEKIENDVSLLKETGFLDDYADQHLVKKI